MKYLAILLMMMSCVSEPVTPKCPKEFIGYPTKHWLNDGKVDTIKNIWYSDYNSTYGYCWCNIERDPSKIRLLVNTRLSTYLKGYPQRAVFKGDTIPIASIEENVTFSGYSWGVNKSKKGITKIDTSIHFATFDSEFSYVIPHFNEVELID